LLCKITSRERLLINDFSVILGIVATEKL